MSDPFKNSAPSLNGLATDLMPVTPADTVDFDTVAVALYVEGAGNLSLESPKSETRTAAVGNFAILPVGVRRVNATGATATGIHAFIVR